jgi:hypothetical protein
LTPDVLVSGARDCPQGRFPLVSAAPRLDRLISAFPALALALEEGIETSLGTPEVVEIE